MNTEINFNERYYSYDAVQAEFDFREKNDILHDDRGTEEGRSQGDTSNLSDPSTNKGSEVWWDAQRSVSADDVPSYYNDFFDAERYFAIDTVVAKSIPQQYYIGDDEYTFIKPNDELQKAVWSVDGKPYTLTHPSEGAVRSTDEIHGFWGQPRHNDDEQQSEATLYFPTHDSNAREFVANNDNVSVGFVNTLVASDQDGIDAEQTDLYYDHVASVKQGRCSDDDGCGLQGFANGNDSAAYVSASTTPVSELNGSIQLTDDSTDNKTMTQCDCGDTNDSGIDFGVSDFGVQKIRTENDAVDAELSSKEDRIDELESELDSAESSHELLTTLADDMGVDGGEELFSEVQSLQDDYEEVREEMESYRTDERNELLTELQERTDSEYHDAFQQTDDESVTEHISRLEDKLETVKMVKGDSSPTTVTPTQTDSTESESDFDATPGAEIDASQFADVQF